LSNADKGAVGFIPAQELAILTSKFFNWPISINFHANTGWISLLNKPTNAILLYPESSF